MAKRVSDYELVAATAQLPPVSAVLQRVLRVLQDPHSDLDDLTRLIGAETSLSVQVVRLANSVHYGLSAPVETVGEAIQRIGVVEISQLATTLMSRQLFLQSLEAYNLSARVLWEHTLATAVCAETLAGYAGLDTGSAYMAGILHPIGMLTLDRVANARGTPRRPRDQSLTTWEQGHFGMSNPEVGEQTLTRWKFPAVVAQTIGGRYEPDARPEGRATASLLHLASTLAGKLGAGLEAEQGMFHSSASCLEAAGIPREDFAESEMEAAQKLDRTRALLSIN